MAKISLALNRNYNYMELAEAEIDMGRFNLDSFNWFKLPL